jgi:hypothetical protein
LSLRQNPGEHGTLILRGIAEQGDLSLPTARKTRGQTLRVSALDENGNEERRPMFSGIITSVSADHEGSLCHVEMEASTATIELDAVPKSRSFQDVGMTYADVVNLVLNDTPGADALFPVGSGAPIGKPLIQYRETDWAFIKRLASHLNAPVIPDATTGNPNLWLGVPHRLEGFSFTGTEYAARLDKTYFALGGSDSGLSKADFLYYLIPDTRNRGIGDSVRVEGRDFIICAKSAELVRGELVFCYKVGLPASVSVPRRYNSGFTGLSLIGVVTKTARETVELALDIDKGKGNGGYPYTWAPATGNLVYSMPQVGTKASLYFPGQDERAAFVNASVRDNGPASAEMSDTQKRGFVTEHGKRLDLFPENLALSNGGGISVDLADASGVTVASGKRARLIAKGAISLTARNIHVQAPNEINTRQTRDVSRLISKALSAGSNMS